MVYAIIDTNIFISPSQLKSLKTLEEISTSILKDPRLNNHHTLNLSLYYFHGVYLINFVFLFTLLTLSRQGKHRRLWRPRRSHAPTKTDCYVICFHSLFQ